MATIKKITVTVPSVVTNDTLAGYNFYSNQMGKLNTNVVSPATAEAGVNYSLTDGVIHNITAKPVGTTNGEFTAVTSAVVVSDLSAEAAAMVTSGEVGAVNSTTIVLTANESLQVVNASGANGFTIDNTAEGTAITVTNVEVKVAEPTKIYLTVTAGLKANSFGIVAVDYVGTLVVGVDTNNLAPISNLTLTNTIVAATVDLFDFLNAASTPNEANTTTGFGAGATIHTQIIGNETANPQTGTRFLKVMSTNTAAGGGSALSVPAGSLNGIAKAGEVYDLEFKYFVPTENTDTQQKVLVETFGAENSFVVQNLGFTAPGTKGTWLDGSITGLRIQSTGVGIYFACRGGATATPNQPVYYDSMRLIKKKVASSLYELYSATEAGGTARTGTKTYTWTPSIVGQMPVVAVTNANGPGAVAGETYLEVSDTGAVFNSSVTLNLGTGIRMIKCKVKMVGTGEVKFGQLKGRKANATNYTTWQEIDFCSSNGFMIVFSQASNGLKVYLADIQVGAIIETTV